MSGSAFISLEFINDHIHHNNYRLYIWNDELIRDISSSESLVLYDEDTLAVGASHDDGIVLLDADTGERKKVITTRITAGRRTFCFCNNMMFVAGRDKFIMYDAEGVMKYSSSVIRNYNIYTGPGFSQPPPIGMAVSNSKKVYLASNGLAEFDPIYRRFRWLAGYDQFNKPLGIAVDSLDQIHVCCSDCVKVVNTQGQLVSSYAFADRTTSSRPTMITVHSTGFKFVVMNEDTVMVFGSENQQLYSVKIQSRRILDILVTPNGMLWISYVNFSVERRMELVRLPFSLVFYPPPPLALFCQSIILLNLAYLPSSLLPPKYLKHIDSWSKLVEVRIIIPGRDLQSLNMRVKPSMSHLDVMEYLMESSLVPTVPGLTKRISVAESFSSITKYEVKLVNYN